MEITPTVFTLVISALKAAEYEATVMQSRLTPPYSANQKAIAQRCREALDALGEQR